MYGRTSKLDSYFKIFIKKKGPLFYWKIVPGIEKTETVDQVKEYRGIILNHLYNIINQIDKIYKRRRYCDIKYRMIKISYQLK